ncbi:beta-lactoglobulin-2-like [Ursus americanus]|uniref:beta-lactoglobulin-2-like n=1 Tax=Ursus americanus TaxID=9643 RepID=UPI001E67B514|nr:beta-lactoglobulin-2-like [Ursus americanus]
MKCLLLALGLALMCGIQGIVIPQTPRALDIRKVAGMWHSMAMAASDISLLDAENAPLRVYVQELRPTPEDNLEIILSKRENSACVEGNIMAQKTEDPAVFTIDYQGERKISVLDTDYTHYLFFCMEAPAPTAESGVICQYLARTLKVDNEVMEKFDGVLKTLPMQMRIILDLTQGKEHSLPASPILQRHLNPLHPRPFLQWVGGVTEEELMPEAENHDPGSVPDAGNQPAPTRPGTSLLVPARNRPGPGDTGTFPLPLRGRRPPIVLVEEAP